MLGSPRTSASGGEDVPLRGGESVLSARDKDRVSLPRTGVVAAGAVAAVLIVVLTVTTAVFAVRARNGSSTPSAADGPAPSPGPSPANPALGPLATAVSVDNMASSIAELMDVASAHLNRDGVPSRSVLNGYNASAQLVIDTLSGFPALDPSWISTVPIVSPIYSQLATPSLTVGHVPLIYAKDYAGVRFSGGGTMQLDDAPAVLLDAGVSGCVAGDYPPAASGAVVVVRVDSAACATVDQVEAAEAAGAAAVLLASGPGSTALTNTRVRGNPWYPGSFLASVPVLAVSDTARALIADAGNVTLAVESSIVVAHSVDVCVDIPSPRSESERSGRVLMLGAHLDSVHEGPGANDDGSGSVAMLELARTYAAQAAAIGSPHDVRICWWGAEEVGLIGSYQYVRHMQDNEPAAWDAVAFYLNHDMLASPNGVRYVHQANDSVATHSVLAEATRLESMYRHAFEIMGLPYAFSAMRSGSDFLPFLLGGKPTGGLLTGAGGIKTVAERDTFGGFANAPYDPCYHQPCDTEANIAWDLLLQNARAVAYVLWTAATADWPAA